MKQIDSREAFVKKLVEKVGYPMWNKCAGYLSEGSNRGNSRNDTLLFIPFAHDEVDQVNSIFACYADGDSIKCRLINGSEYVNFGRDMSITRLSSELVVSHIMYMESLSFANHDSFRINDPKLFLAEDYKVNGTSANTVKIKDPGQRPKDDRGKKNSSGPKVIGMGSSCWSVKVDCMEFEDRSNVLLGPVYLEVCVDIPLWENEVSVFPSIVMSQSGGESPGSAYNLFNSANCQNTLPDSCGPRPLGWHPILLEETPNTYNPYQADTIGLTSRFKSKYPCLANFIEDSMLNGSHPNVIAQLAGVDVFRNSVKTHLTFDTSTIHTQAGQHMATTTTSNIQVINGVTHYWAMIEFNGWYLRNGTRESTIQTTIHELMRAVFKMRWEQYERWVQFGSPNPIDSNWMKTRYPIQWYYKTQQALTSAQINHHELIGSDYNEVFKQLLTIYWNPGSPISIRDSVIKALCYTGIKETTVWKNLPNRGIDTCRYKAIQIAAQRALTYQFTLTGCSQTYNLHYSDSLKLTPSCY